MQYYYNQQRSSAPQLSGTSKALLAGIGALLGHRALVGVKRTVLLGKLRKAGFQSLHHGEKAALLRNMKIDPSYKKWLKKKI